MGVSLALAVSPGSPSAGQTVTATYVLSGNTAGAATTVTFTGTASGALSGPVSGSFAVGGAPASVTFGVPTCPGLTFQKGSAANVFTAVASAGSGGASTVSGSAVVGGVTLKATASVTLPASSVTVPPPPASGTAPYPAALATGHALLNEYAPADLFAWRYAPGTTTPVTNGGGITEDPGSTRNVSVVTDGGLSVLKLATTSVSDCGVIQSPGKYSTSSGVIETLIKFSGFTNGSGRVFANWSSFWMYGDDWPAQGEIDAVETQYGNSFVSYHYGSGTGSNATTDPWTYAGKTVQLQPKNSTSAPVAPNILPDAWTYVTLAFGKDAAGNHKVDVYYNGVLYCTIDAAWVTGDPMYVTSGVSFGGPGLGTNQTPFDQPGSIEIQYVRVFS